MFVKATSETKQEQVTALQDATLRRYLATGDHGPSYLHWPGDNYLEAEIQADAALRTALITAVRDHSSRVPELPVVRVGDISSLTRSKVAPMVAGLFPKAEQAVVMTMLERSVVFLTPDNIESILNASSWPSTTWDLANLYLLSIGAKALSPNARAIVGLSEETTCFLSIEYLLNQNPEPFGDYLVHEAAHVFHNCKRGTVGLEQTRHREWLLDINFRMRETFAYCCEAYSRILVLGDTQKRRRQLFEEHADQYLISDDSLDQDEYHDILSDAVEARNGWKRILKRCAASKP